MIEFLAQDADRHDDISHNSGFSGIAGSAEMGAATLEHERPSRRARLSELGIIPLPIRGVDATILLRVDKALTFRAPIDAIINGRLVTIWQ